jgi:hypothetical protein
MHHDGGGLYLQITEGRSGINKSWLFRYTVGKKSRYLGLGIYPFIGLSDAREKAGHARKLLGQGTDQLLTNTLHGPPCVSNRPRSSPSANAPIRTSGRIVRAGAVFVTPRTGSDL